MNGDDDKFFLPLHKHSQFHIFLFIPAVINVMVDPDGTLDALTSLGLTSPTTPKPRSSPGSQSGWGPLPTNGSTQPTMNITSTSQELPSVGHNFNRSHPTGEESAIASK